MRRPHRAIVSIAITTLAAMILSTAAYTQAAISYDELAKNEAAANADNGKRVAPVKSIANPSNDVSAGMQAMIGAPFPPHFNADPKTASEWKELIDRRAKLSIAGIPAMKEKLGVKVEETKIAGVHCFIVTPNRTPPENRRRLLVHVHGGGYVSGPGEAALPEAIMMAGFGGLKVISVDYRMPPDFPLSSRDGRCDGGLEGGDLGTRFAPDGDLRHVDGRRHDACDGAAGEGREAAEAGRHRTGHALGRYRQDRRHLCQQ
jgi:hypothetical protein